VHSGNWMGSQGAASHHVMQQRVKELDKGNGDAEGVNGMLSVRGVSMGFWIRRWR
jgi:hypothetical protein